MTKRTFPSFLLYPDENGRWRWSYADSSGNEVAAATAAYGTRDSCMRAIRDLQQSDGQPAYAFQPGNRARTAPDKGSALLDLDPEQIVT